MIRMLLDTIRGRRLPAPRLTEAERRELQIDRLGPLQGTFTGNCAARAIAYALDLNDPFEADEFLRAWTVGDTREWPDFKPDVVGS